MPPSSDVRLASRTPRTRRLTTLVRRRLPRAALAAARAARPGSLFVPASGPAPAAVAGGLVDAGCG